MLPLRLGGQSRARPARISVCLKVRQVHHGLLIPQGAQPGQRELAPGEIDTLPVQGLLQPLGSAPVPAFGQPVGRIAVATIVHKDGKLGIGDEARSQRIGLQIHPVAGALVVKRKAIARMANLAKPAGQHMPDQWLCGFRFGGHRLRRVVGRMHRIARQQVLDVGQQQLLVLLLVLQAQLHQRAQRRVVGQRGQQAQHACIHIRPIGQHLGQRRAREQPALWPRVAGAHTVVVGVEQHPKRWMKRRKAALVRLQHKGFKKPGGVGQMPFGRARVGHGLGAAVFGRQGRCQGHGVAPNVEVAGKQGIHGQTAPMQTVQGRACTTANQPCSSVQACARENPACASMVVNTPRGYL